MIHLVGGGVVFEVRHNRKKWRETLVVVLVQYLVAVVSDVELGS